MEFFSRNRDTNCEIVSSLINRDWDFSDNKQGVEFEMSMQKYYIKYIDGTVLTKEQRQTAIDNFESLNSITDVHLAETLSGAEFDHNKCVAYINRGKPRTIIAVSGGSWPLNVCRNSVEHQYSWMLNEYDKDNVFQEYNVISIVEDPSRSFINPILYDSCLYKGINQELDSTYKLSEYIEKLIPNTEYHLVADCKNGHSTAMLAYHLQARSLLIQSGVSHCDYNRILKQYDTDGKYELELWGDISFQLLFRQMQFCNDIPERLLSINNIASCMPNCKFSYVYHEDDIAFKDYIDNVNGRLIEKTAVKSTPHTFGNHYITLELRRSGFFRNHFSL